VEQNWVIGAPKPGNGPDTPDPVRPSEFRHPPHQQPVAARDFNMPRYIVERSFPNGLVIPMDEAGASACLNVVDNNSEKGVTWVHSYVSPDRLQTFCVYDGPSPEAIRSVAQKNAMPVGKITEVRVLDPYFYR